MRWRSHVDRDPECQLRPGGPRLSRSLMGVRWRQGLGRPGQSQRGVGTKMEPEKRRSPTESEGWRDEAQPKECKTEVEADQRLTKAEPEGRLSLWTLRTNGTQWSQRIEAPRRRRNIKKAEVESSARRPEVEPGDHHSRVKLETGRSEVTSHSRVATEGEQTNRRETAEMGLKNWLSMDEEAEEGGWVSASTMTLT